MAEPTLPEPYSNAVRALYSGNLDDFVATRTALARTATQSDDRAVAAQIKKLRKPTRGGWLLNLLAADDGELVQQVRQLGAELAAAHRDSDAAALRRLTAERGRLLRTAGARLAELGAAHGWQPTQSALTEATETLQAALADPELGERIAAGAMAATVRAAGFGPVDLFAPLAPVIPLRPRAERAATRKTEQPATGPDTETVRRLERELGGAEVRLSDARQAAERAEQARDEAYAEAEQAENRARELAAAIDALRTQLSAAEAEAAALAQQRKRLAASAEKTTEAASRAADELTERQRAVDELQALLDEL